MPLINGGGVLLIIDWECLLINDGECLLIKYGECVQQSLWNIGKWLPSNLGEESLLQQNDMSICNVGMGPPPLMRDTSCKMKGTQASSAIGVSTHFETCLQPFLSAKDEDIKRRRPRRRLSLNI